MLAEDFDLSLLGITDEDLDALLRDPDALGGGGPVEGEYDIPEPRVTPVSAPGELWQLGSHRLICGDSTAADVVDRLWHERQEINGDQLAMGHEVAVRQAVIRLQRAVRQQLDRLFGWFSTPVLRHSRKSALPNRRRIAV